MSISDMFSKAFEDAAKKPMTRTSTAPKGPKKDSYEFSKFEANWNWGTATGVLIPDANNIPFRVIKNMYLGSFVKKDDEGKDVKVPVVFASSSSYTKELTKEERDINEEIYKQIQELNGKMIGPNGRPIDKSYKVKRVKEYTLLYLLLNKRTDDHLDEDDPNYTKEYSEPGVVVYANRTTGFLDKMKDAIKVKNDESEDENWMDAYFNRNVGERHDFTLIKTILNEQSKRYDITISLPHYGKKTVNVTEEHLNTAKDITKEVIDLNSYNMEYNIELLESLKSVNKGLDEAKKLDTEKKPDLGLGNPNLTNA